MNTLPADINPETFGSEVIRILKQYGFGVLGKSDLEAVLLRAIERSSPEFRRGDSYAHAEMLRITDQKYRSLSRRAGMWLGDDHGALPDAVLFHDLLKRALVAYQDCPTEKEVRVVIDDELLRRNMQRALERASLRGSSIAVEISLTGRSLVLRGSDLDRMIERIETSQAVGDELMALISVRDGRARRQSVLEFIKQGGEVVLSTVASAMLNGMAGAS